eukprot:Opistho-2@69515
MSDDASHSNGKVGLENGSHDALSEIPANLAPASEAPTGEVALVFTDIQGSTQLWDTVPETMKQAIIMHNNMMRRLLKKYNGYEVKTEGDAFMVAFQDVIGALKWCLEAQLELMRTKWPRELLEVEAGKEEKSEDDIVLFRGLRVRMGIHKGSPHCEPDPTHGRMDYFGPVVNRAARVAGIAEGGQIIVSRSVIEDVVNRWDELQEFDPVQAELGSFKLKGLGDAEFLTQIYPRELPRQFGTHDTTDPWFSFTSGRDINKSSKAETTQRRTSQQAPRALPLPKPEENNISWLVPSAEIRLGVKLGSGASGEMYKADWKGMKVAVKKLFRQKMDDTALEDWKTELSILSQIRHPNCILFMGAILEPGKMWIISEYMPKGSLHDVLHDTSQSLSWPQRINMSKDVARAMLYLHTYKPPIIHRDLKSHNMLVDNNFVVKVGDFGFARILASSSVMTQCGTMCWTAPEILRGKKYDEKVDLYSYGIVLWEIGTRQDPHEGVNALKLAMKVLQGERPPVPKYFPDFYTELMTACWADDPTQRPDFGEVLDKLDSISVQQLNSISRASISIKSITSKKKTPDTAASDKGNQQSSACAIL